MRSRPDDSEGNPLLFIGCRIPAVGVDGVSTKRIMCFTNARFLGDVEFANVLCGAVDFTDAKFVGQLRMTATTADVVRLRKSCFGSGHGKASDDGGGKAAVDLRGCKFDSCDMAIASLASARLEDCKIGTANFRKSEINDLSAERCDFADMTDFFACGLGHVQFLEVASGGTAACAPGLGGLRSSRGRQGAHDAGGRNADAASAGRRGQLILRPGAACPCRNRNRAAAKRPQR